MELWYIAVGAAVLILIALLFRRRKIKVVETPQSKVPVELEKHKQQIEKIEKIKKLVEKRDNEASKKLEQREKEYEEDLKSPPDVDDIKSKLKLIRSKRNT